MKQKEKYPEEIHKLKFVLSYGQIPEKAEYSSGVLYSHVYLFFLVDQLDWRIDFQVVEVKAVVSSPLFGHGEVCKELHYLKKTILKHAVLFVLQKKKYYLQINF